MIMVIDMSSIKLRSPLLIKFRTWLHSRPSKLSLDRPKIAGTPKPALYEVQQR